MNRVVSDSEPRGETIRAGHEPDRVPALMVMALAIGLAAVVVLVQLGAGFLMKRVGRPYVSPHPLTEAAQRRLAGADHWAVQPEDLEALRRAEDRNLTGYGWIDKQAGVVRIPLDRAMQLVAAEHAERPKENER